MAGSGDGPLVRSRTFADNARMGYIIAIIAVLILVPLVIVFAGRRPGHGGMENSKDGPAKSVIRDEPSADEPSPTGSSNVNSGSPEATRRLPPS